MDESYNMSKLNKRRVYMLIEKSKTLSRYGKNPLNEDAMLGNTFFVDVAYPDFPVRARFVCPALRLVGTDALLVHLSTFAVRCAGDRLRRSEHTVNK